MYSIRVSSEELFEDTISPMIYGDFIEFLNDMIPGMWAEKIQDRCFEGILQPNYTWPPDTNWAYPRWKLLFQENLSLIDGLITKILKWLMLLQTMI